MNGLMPYDRERAANYAIKWALGSNPAYMNYDEMGGDCTNFISQCVKAGNVPFDKGSDIMKSWYWYSDASRTPSWTGAQQFYEYIIGNNNDKTSNYGIYTRPARYNELELGDLVQLVYEGKAYHTMIVTDIILEGEYLIDYLICQHTYNLLNYPLELKEGEKRYIKILGYYN